MKQYPVNLMDFGRAVCMSLFMTGLCVTIGGGVVGVVTNTMWMALVAVGVGIGMLSMMLWRQFNLFKWFCCHMGWHSPSRLWTWSKHPDDPNQFLDFAVCPWCGYKGMVDSQGNLF